MKTNIINPLKLLVAMLVVTCCSGCKFWDSIKDKFSKDSSSKQVTVTESVVNDDSPAIAFIDGEPVLRKSEFEEYVAQVLQANPQFQGVMTADSLPLSFKKNILSQLVDAEVLVAWQKKHNVDKTDEFKRMMEQLLKNIRRTMLIQEFQKSIYSGIEVQDSEIRSDFDMNKDRYIKKAGGTLAMGMKFDNQEEAQRFIAKVQGKEKDFETLAKEVKESAFKQFGRVNAMTMNRDIPASVKNEILKLEDKAPTVISVKDNNDVWVVCLEGNEKPEYYNFDDIKGQIEMALRNQKSQEVFMKKFDEIKKAVKVEIKDDLLVSKNALPEEDMVSVEPSIDSVEQKAPTVA